MTLLFCIVFLALSIGNLLVPQKAFSENENRPLQTLPDFSAARLFSGKYASEFETYTTDQFIGRDKWVSLKTISELALNKKDNGRVYFGKDLYLFEVNDTLDRAQFNQNKKSLSNFLLRLSTDYPDIHASVMIAPTASEVLQEKLPSYAPALNQKEIIEEVGTSLPKNVVFSDVLPTLTEKNKDYIYYRTDHHWTSTGAYYAYTHWAEQMGLTPLTEDELKIRTVSDSFYGTNYSKANLYSIPPDRIYAYDPVKPISFTITYDKGERTMEGLYDESFVGKKDKYSYFLGGNNPYLDIASTNKNGKTLLVIKDSYAHSFIPFAANHYEQVLVLDLRYMKTPISTLLSENKIDDVLVLYNTATFTSDRNLAYISK